MKKIVSCLAVLAMISAMVSCGKDDSSTTSKSSDAKTTTAATDATTESQTEDTTESLTESTTESQTESTASADNQASNNAETENTSSSEGIQPAVGTWYESDALDPRILTISGDGSFELAYRGGGSRFGTVKLETTENPDGSTQDCYNLYDVDEELYASFPKTVTGSGETEDHLISIQGAEQFSFSRTPEYTTEFDETTNEYDFSPYTEEQAEGTSFQDIEGE